ncbi:MAG: hypothetical protein ACRD96_01160 [Bryobacteraceae bacterium]
MQIVLIAWALLAVEPARLVPYPQKFREFYKLDDPLVPQALKDSTTTETAEWRGTAQGLYRFDMRAPVDDRWQYFAGRRYLPDDEVLAILPGRDDIWVRTRTGVSRIRFVPMTLAQKADTFEKRIATRHDRYGMIASSAFREPGNPATNYTHDNDNDGLWTAMYAAAQCFRYAVTKSPDALDRARRAVEAVLLLEQVTGRPGFPARSYIKKGDTRGKGGVWHWTPDGAYEWKADTSSDEIAGHFYIFSIAHDLLPGAALKKRIASTAARIMDHIIAHGYHLVDVTGEPTYWGRWSPAYFETSRGRPDAPLNALELLSFLKTTAHLTGDPKYETEYRKVALEMKYLDLTQRLLELRRQINYSDEELAMLSFYPLFRYERDPKMLDGYRRAANQWWENIRREKNPLWTFIHLVGQPEAEVDLAGAVWTLYRTPMDLITWAVKNSHRREVEMEKDLDRFKQPQARTLLPPDERPVMKWNGNPFRVDGGGNGSSEDDGTFFLLPYWMGRYHKFLLGE